MDEQFVDVDVPQPIAEELAAIAAAPDDPVALMERAGVGIGELIRPEERLARILSLVPLQENRRARSNEWRYAREEVFRAAEHIKAFALTMDRLVDRAVMDAPIEELDASLAAIEAGVRGQREFWLGVGLLRVARLAGAEGAETSLWARRMDEANEHLDEVTARITALRNASQRNADRSVLLDARQVASASVARLFDALRACAPENDVELAAPHEARGYGVFFGQALDVFLPTLSLVGASVAIVEAIKQWAQGEHDASGGRPLYLSIRGRTGFLLQKLTWEANAHGPTMDTSIPPSRPAPRPGRP
jgi:hypothetical protein